MNSWPTPLFDSNGCSSLVVALVPHFRLSVDRHQPIAVSIRYESRITYLGHMNWHSNNCSVPRISFIEHIVDIEHWILPVFIRVISGKACRWARSSEGNKSIINSCGGDIVTTPYVWLYLYALRSMPFQLKFQNLLLVRHRLSSTWASVRSSGSHCVMRPIWSNALLANQLMQQVIPIGRPNMTHRIHAIQQPQRNALECVYCVSMELYKLTHIFDRFPYEINCLRKQWHPMAQTIRHRAVKLNKHTAAERASRV